MQIGTEQNNRQLKAETSWSEPPVSNFSVFMMCWCVEGFLITFNSVTNVAWSNLRKIRLLELWDDGKDVHLLVGDKSTQRCGETRDSEGKKLKREVKIRVDHQQRPECTLPKEPGCDTDPCCTAMQQRENRFQHNPNSFKWSQHIL